MAVEPAGLRLICVGLLLSLVALTQMGLLLPLALTGTFAFLSIRMEDLTVLDYIRFAAKFTISTQQEYRWRSTERRQS